MNSFSPERRAFVLSPHQDDAVIAIGHHLLQYGEVEVANVFTQSTSHILEGVPEDATIVSALRNAEDTAIATTYGFKFTDGNFEDSEIRGIAWNDYWAVGDPQLELHVEDYVRDFLGDAKDTDIYIPSAFGLHPDHLVTHKIGSLIAQELRGAACYFYADQPYYDNPMPVRLPIHDQLNHARRLVLPFDADSKRLMLEKYPSQLTAERVDWLTRRGAEYIWPLGAIAAASAQRYAAARPIFDSDSWQNAVTKLHSEEGDVVVVPKVADSDGNEVMMPLFVDQHDVNDNAVRFLRPNGAGYYDYYDLNGSGGCDAGTFETLIDAVKPHGDVLWLTGIREDSSLLTLLTDRTKDTKALIFEGAPSYLADCHPDGFAAWASNKPATTRKKIRRNERKIRDLVEQHSGIISISDANYGILDAFFELQRMRAKTSEGMLDAFGDDVSYRTLLTDLAAQGSLQACTVHADEKTIGVMLFSGVDKVGVLHIINQGFDPEYAQYGVGFLMQQELIRYAHSKHARCVDYLKGDEAYKQWYSNRTLNVYKYVEPMSNLSHHEWNDVKVYVAGYVE